MLAICLAALEDDRERAAFLALYARCERLLLRIALGFFPGDIGRAADAVQETFLAAAKNFEKIFSENAQKQDAYLVIILKNKCRNILRREKKYAPAEEWEPGAGGDSTHAQVEAGDTVRRVHALLGRLPEEYRRVLYLRLVEGLGNGETARRLGLSQSAASRRFQKGRELLAQMLREEGIGLDR